MHVSSRYILKCCASRAKKRESDSHAPSRSTGRKAAIEAGTCGGAARGEAGAGGGGGAAAASARAMPSTLGARDPLGVGRHDRGGAAIATARTERAAGAAFGAARAGAP